MQDQQHIRWRIFESASVLQDAATEAILRTANASIRQRGQFLIVLAGGTTPKEIYTRMRNADTDWSRWHVFYGDERCLAPEDPDRNSHMADAALLQHVGIPADQIHVMPAELGPDEAARRYSDQMADVGTFDCVLLGMGEDAHTASLFPNQTWDASDGAPAIAVRNSPKPPSDRVSLSAVRLSNARQVMFFVTGAGKRDAVKAWKNGESVPVAAIRPDAGVDVYIDTAANVE
jgi:6-phosphogluconolactonase